MSRDDDDLSRNEGEDFQFDESEEFSIPDSPYAEEDGQSSEDDFDLDAMEFTVGDEPQQGETLEVEGEEFSIDGFEVEGAEHGNNEQLTAEHAYQEEPGETEDYQEPSKPGWKTWATLGTLGVGVFSAILYVMMPSGSGQTMPVASNQGTLQSQIEQAQNPAEHSTTAPITPPASGPVTVDAFPVSNVEEAEVPSSEQLLAEQAPAVPRQISEPINETPIKDPSEPRTDGGQFDFESVRGDVLSERAIEKMGNKFVVKGDFNSLKSTVREHTNRLNSLASAHGRTQEDVKDLDRRVTLLESRLGSGKETQTSNAEAKTEAQPEVDAKYADHPILGDPAKIRELQRKLEAYNYHPGPIDGVFGKQTHGAIRRVQWEHGLYTDGKIGPKTMEALDNLKRYSGTYGQKKQQVASTPANNSRGTAISTTTLAANATPDWIVRGITAKRAIVYKQDGTSYPVSIGSEVPGMGQVLELRPAQQEVVTAHGVIKGLENVGR